MKIAGIWSGHDCSYCILENGRPIIHDEYERFIREKEPAGDSVRFLLDNYLDSGDISHAATVLPIKKTQDHPESLSELGAILKKNNGNFYIMGHHQSHAANAFFSSNFNESLILTIDGGGIEDNNMTTAFTVWQGKETQILPIHKFPVNVVNIGGLWTRCTRYIFKLQSGWPRGHQAGSVMAMAAFGDASRFHNDFHQMLTTDLTMASHKPSTQPKGALVPGKDPIHPYLNHWAEIADKSEKDKFDLAAGLQSATESLFRQILISIFEKIPTKNICLAGGVTLNSVMMGKLQSWFPHIENLYFTPTPHDGGLTVGACQYVWHHVLGNPRITWSDNFTPYLGKTYSREEAMLAVSERAAEVVVRDANDEEVLNLLDDQSIISVFGGGSESGRRALGNRSILADPRSPLMKDKINDRVKHRQWFRPFAPSVLREEVVNWFERDVESPYMSLVINFKESVRDKVPAVVHHDGTARLQTVSKNDNPWYYEFLQQWHKKSGVPILLNTSFNDREPICETPLHALDCFLRTDIDYLYFPDFGLLVQKK